MSVRLTSRKAKTEIEEHGAIYFGPGEEEHLRQGHEVELKYGFTDRWEGILEGVFKQDIGEDLEARQIEVGAQDEIVQREGNGLGVALRTLYEFALQSDSPDEILFGPLAKYCGAAIRSPRTCSSSASSVTKPRSTGSSSRSTGA